MPCVMTLVFLLTRMLILRAFRLLVACFRRGTTIFCAASAMLSAEMIGSPDSARILLAQLLVGALHAHDQRHGEVRLLRRGDDAVGDRRRSS